MRGRGLPRITYFIDRPDVMATLLRHDLRGQGRFPRLLANGNLVAARRGVPRGWFLAGEAGNRHWARWEDPFPKPSYLFAMVAAKLELLEDHFVTRSGKKALLQIYVEPGKLDQAASRCRRSRNACAGTRRYSASSSTSSAS
jgi:aminopeptidase N